MEDLKLQLSELYIAYFGRAPDADGLAYWLTEMENGVMDYDAVAANWSNEQQEFVEIYGEDVTHEDFIAQVYENVLGRAPDADGLAYWSTEMTAGTLDTTNLVQAVVAGAKASTGNPEDAKILGNRAEVGVALADAGINDMAFAAQVVAAVSADETTVGLVNSVIEMAAVDSKSIASATETLVAVETMLNDETAADTLADTLINLATMMETIASDVVSGNVTDIGLTLSAAATTVEAARHDHTFVDDPEALAQSVSEDPEAAESDAQDTVDSATDDTTTTSDGGSTYTPPPADTTAPTMSSAIVSEDGMTIVITYNEELTEGTFTETADFEVSLLTGASAPGVDEFTVLGSTVTLTLDEAINSGSDLLSSITYTALAGDENTIKDDATTPNAAQSQILSSSITNNSTVADTTAPDKADVQPYSVAEDADGQAGFSDGDLITIRFSEPIVTSNVTTLSVNNSHTLGSAIISALNPTNGYASAFTITLANSDATLIAGDIISIQDARVIDYAGSKADGYINFTVTEPVDTTPPTATASLTSVTDNIGLITGALTTAGVTDDTSLVIVGTISEALAGADVVAIYDGVTKLGTASVTGTDWTYTDSTLADTDAVSYTVKVEDAAGNSSSTTTAFTTTIDTTAPTITVAPAIASTKTISLTTNEATYATVYDAIPSEVVTGVNLSANSSGAITVSAQATTATSGTISVTDVAGNTTQSITVGLGTDGDDTVNGDTNDNIIFGFAGNDTIGGLDGVDKILAGAGNDSIDAGTGNDIVRGGADVDTISGGTEDDTFVVLGTILADDYTSSDVGTSTGAYALGLTNLIDTGLATSDSGADGTGETYDGGAGTNVMEIWGDANLTNANISNINAFNTHSDLTISATQLNSLFTNNGAAVTLNLLDSASTINITGVTQAMGMTLLNSFSAGIDSTDATLLSGAPTIAFDMYSLSDSVATSYTIKPEDMYDLNSDGALDDATGENSVMATNNLNVNAGDGDDVIAVTTMSTSVNVDGGAGDDILLFTDTNGTTTDLDNVTNVEIVVLQGGAANITTVDTFVVNTVQTAGVAIDARDLSAGLTFDGTLESDGFFKINGSSFGDTITGGAKADYINLGTNADGSASDNVADTLIIGQGASLISSTDLISNFDINTDIIDYYIDLSLGGDSATPATAGNAIISASGLATFDAADDTFDKKLTAVVTDLAYANNSTAGKVAIFEDSGNTYVYLTDADSATITGDELITLVGVTNLDTITVTTGNITITGP